MLYTSKYIAIILIKQKTREVQENRHKHINSRISFRLYKKISLSNKMPDLHIIKDEEKRKPIKQKKI